VAVYPPQIGLKFRSAKRIYVPLGHAKFHVNWCNESPLWGENADFRPLSKFNTGSRHFAAILPATDIQTPYFRTYSRRVLLNLPKLCMVVEDDETILKGINHFSIQPIVFHRAR